MASLDTSMDGMANASMASMASYSHLDNASTRLEPISTRNNTPSASGRLEIDAVATAGNSFDRKSSSSGAAMGLPRGVGSFSAAVANASNPGGAISRGASRSASAASMQLTRAASAATATASTMVASASIKPSANRPGSARISAAVAEALDSVHADEVVVDDDDAGFDDADVDGMWSTESAHPSMSKLVPNAAHAGTAVGAAAGNAGNNANSRSNSLHRMSSASNTRATVTDTGVMILGSPAAAAVAAASVAQQPFASAQPEIAGGPSSSFSVAAIGVPAVSAAAPTAAYSSASSIASHQHQYSGAPSRTGSFRSAASGGASAIVDQQASSSASASAAIAGAISTSVSLSRKPSSASVSAPSSSSLSFAATPVVGNVLAVAPASSSASATAAAAVGPLTAAVASSAAAVSVAPVPAPHPQPHQTTRSSGPRLPMLSGHAPSSQQQASHPLSSYPTASATTGPGSGSGFDSGLESTGVSVPARLQPRSSGSLQFSSFVAQHVGSGGQQPHQAHQSYQQHAQIGSSTLSGSLNGLNGFAEANFSQPNLQTQQNMQQSATSGSAIRARAASPESIRATAAILQASRISTQIAERARAVATPGPSATAAAAPGTLGAQPWSNTASTGAATASVNASSLGGVGAAGGLSRASSPGGPRRPPQLGGAGAAPIGGVTVSPSMQHQSQPSSASVLPQTRIAPRGFSAAVAVTLSGGSGSSSNAHYPGASAMAMRASSSSGVADARPAIALPSAGSSAGANAAVGAAGVAPGSASIAVLHPSSPGIVAAASASSVAHAVASRVADRLSPPKQQQSLARSAASTAAVSGSGAASSSVFLNQPVSPPRVEPPPHHHVSAVATAPAAASSSDAAVSSLTDGHRRSVLTTGSLLAEALSPVRHQHRQKAKGASASGANHSPASPLGGSPGYHQDNGIHAHDGVQQQHDGEGNNGDGDYDDDEAVESRESALLASLRESIALTDALINETEAEPDNGNIQNSGTSNNSGRGATASGSTSAGKRLVGGVVAAVADILGGDGDGPIDVGALLNAGGTSDVDDDDEDEDVAGGDDDRRNTGAYSPAAHHRYHYHGDAGDTADDADADDGADRIPDLDDLVKRTLLHGSLGSSSSASSGPKHHHHHHRHHHRKSRHDRDSSNAAAADSAVAAVGDVAGKRSSRRLHRESNGVIEKTTADKHQEPNQYSAPLLSDLSPMHGSAPAVVTLAAAPPPAAAVPAPAPAAPTASSASASALLSTAPLASAVARTPMPSRTPSSKSIAASTTSASARTISSSVSTGGRNFAYGAGTATSEKQSRRRSSSGMRGSTGLPYTSLAQTQAEVREVTLLADRLQQLLSPASAARAARAVVFEDENGTGAGAPGTRSGAAEFASTGGRPVGHATVAHDAGVNVAEGAGADADTDDANALLASQLEAALQSGADIGDITALVESSMLTGHANDEGSSADEGGLYQQQLQSDAGRRAGSATCVLPALGATGPAFAATLLPPATAVTSSTVPAITSGAAPASSTAALAPGAATGSTSSASDVQFQSQVQTMLSTLSQQVQSLQLQLQLQAQHPSLMAQLLLANNGTGIAGVGAHGGVAADGQAGFRTIGGLPSASAAEADVSSSPPPSSSRSPHRGPSSPMLDVDADGVDDSDRGDAEYADTEYQQEQRQNYGTDSHSPDDVNDDGHHLLSYAFPAGDHQASDGQYAASQPRSYAAGASNRRRVPEATPDRILSPRTAYDKRSVLARSAAIIDGGLHHASNAAAASEASNSGSSGAGGGMRGRNAGRNSSRSHSSSAGATNVYSGPHPYLNSDFYRHHHQQQQTQQLLQQQQKRQEVALDAGLSRFSQSFPSPGMHVSPAADTPSPSRFSYNQSSSNGGVAYDSNSGGSAYGTHHHHSSAPYVTRAESPLATVTVLHNHHHHHNDGGGYEDRYHHHHGQEGTGAYTRNSNTGGFTHHGGLTAYRQLQQHGVAGLSATAPTASAGSHSKSPISRFAFDPGARTSAGAGAAGMSAAASSEIAFGKAYHRLAPEAAAVGGRSVSTGRQLPGHPGGPKRRGASRSRSRSPAASKTLQAALSRSAYAAAVTASSSSSALPAPSSAAGNLLSSAPILLPERIRRSSTGGGMQALPFTSTMPAGPSTDTAIASNPSMMMQHQYQYQSGGDAAAAGGGGSADVRHHSSSSSPPSAMYALPASYYPGGSTRPNGAPQIVVSASAPADATPGTGSALPMMMTAHPYTGYVPAIDPTAPRLEQFLRPSTSSSSSSSSSNVHFNGKGVQYNGGSFIGAASSGLGAAFGASGVGSLQLSQSMQGLGLAGSRVQTAAAATATAASGHYLGQSQPSYQLRTQQQQQQQAHGDQTSHLSSWSPQKQHVQLRGF